MEHSGLRTQTRNSSLYQTHEVTNQPPPLVGYNIYSCDSALKAAVLREGAGWADQELARFGETVGGQPLEWGVLANRHTPELQSHDRFGNRIDDIRFHPAWHSLLKLGIENQVHSLPWTSNEDGAHVARAALFCTLAQAEAGVMCPISMTFSAIPAIANDPVIDNEWRPRLTSSSYERGALCGMALTEKQGGSDVGSNTTAATLVAEREYELVGHKWFCSHPVCDAFLVLARTPDAGPGSRGLSCFLLPRVLPDGSRNSIYIQRLKDKLGTRSLASGEVELAGASAALIGAEGQGLEVIMEMVNHTRLDCVLGSSAAMRRAVSEATHHAAHRAAFGNTLIDQPLMQNVLADLCIEYEAAVAAGFRLARAFDSDDEPAFKRLATAVTKYYVCKIAPIVAIEALECLGGNGYVEDSPMPRIYRDVQVNSTWEGSGNVIALDVLRVLAKEPEALDAFFAEVELGAGIDTNLDRAIAAARTQLSALIASENPQYGARLTTELLAKVLQGSLLVRAANSEPSLASVAEGFCASRLNGHGRAFGTLPPGLDCEAIIERSRPRLDQ